MDGKFGSWQKSSHFSYKTVVGITDSGFVVKGFDGKEQTVVVNNDTQIIKGEEKVEKGVSIGDKVYVVGSLVEASMIKIFDTNASDIKKQLE